MDKEQVKELAENAEPYINQFAGKFMEWIEATETLAKTEVPEVIKEIILWGVVENWFVAGMHLLIFIGCLYWWYLVKKNGEEWWGGEKSGEHEAATIMGTVVASIATGITLIAMPTYFYAGLKPLIVPRLYLLEYFSNLVK